VFPLGDSANFFTNWGLAELDTLDLAYPTVLARFGIAQYHDGRKVGCKLNVREVLSPYCQRKKNVTVERLDQYSEADERWMEAVVEDPQTPVFEQVQFRCDFPAWLGTLSRRDRRVAEILALGNRTSDVARKFNVSEGRVSQLRRELAESRHAFVGDEPTPEVA
jgi:hypothetical protein